MNTPEIQLRTICEKCCGNGYEGGDRTRPCLLCGQLGYVYRWVPLEQAIHEAHVEATQRAGDTRLQHQYRRRVEWIEEQK